jgi:hypothetical protein
VQAVQQERSSFRSVSAIRDGGIGSAPQIAAFPIRLRSDAGRRLQLGHHGFKLRPFWKGRFYAIIKSSRRKFFIGKKNRVHVSAVTAQWYEYWLWGSRNERTAKQPKALAEDFKIAGGTVKRCPVRRIEQKQKPK